MFGVVVLAGCTSEWKKHEIHLAQLEREGDWANAESEEHWLIDNSFADAPANERSTEDEADRYLRLADYAIKKGDSREAIEALRQALTIDPSCSSSVQKKLGRLPLPPRDRQKVIAEFAWNIAAMTPDDSGMLEYQREQSNCWSYRVRQIRIRHNQVINTERGKERQVSYDARSWAFDAAEGKWHAEGNWMSDVGSESELVGGPESGRYRAVVAANHGFYTDGKVPPCHRDGWSGPYDKNETVFVTTELPVGSASGND
ncbi:MAG TPA: tetratricopeptide repeat protein [Candidatus Acidoferrales bacterium]|nr:tetratricopeptide repeat protein [Candidatus Acidoferrales bacterium]